MYKRLAFFGLKLALAFGILFWLYNQNLLNVSALSSLHFNVKTTGLVIVAGGLVLGAIALLAVRLILLLNPYGINISFNRALAVSLLGALFGAILPGLVAGDVVKAAYLFSDAEGKKSRIVATVIIDRIVGLYGLFLLGATAVLAAWVTLSLPNATEVLLVGPIGSCIATAGLIIGFMIGASNVRITRQIITRLPEKLRNLLEALVQYRNYPRHLLLAIGLSIISHAMIVFTFIIGAFLLQDSLPLYAHFVVDPIAMTLNMIPLTPGGLGVTESAFSFLFAMMGSSNGSLVALFGRIIQYVVFATGGGIALIATRMGAVVPLHPQSNLFFKVQSMFGLR